MLSLWVIQAVPVASFVIASVITPTVWPHGLDWLPPALLDPPELLRAFAIALRRSVFVRLIFPHRDARPRCRDRDSSTCSYFLKARLLSGPLW